jgi:hypothetical protein
MTKQEQGDEGYSDLREKLQSALPPMKDAELQRDLWPLMRQRMEERPGYAFAAGVPWFDWVLLGFASVALVFFPALIPALLYHL